MDIKLEHPDGQHIGWSHLPMATDPPRVLFEGERAYYYGGYLEGATATAEQLREYWLYKSTKPHDLAAAVTRERPER